MEVSVVFRRQTMAIIFGNCSPQWAPIILQYICISLSVYIYNNNTRYQSCTIARKIGGDVQILITIILSETYFKCYLDAVTYVNCSVLAYPHLAPFTIVTKREQFYSTEIIRSFFKNAPENISVLIQINYDRLPCEDKTKINLIMI